MTRLSTTTCSNGTSTTVVPTPLVHAAASSLAELVSCALLTPAEVIKQNAQMVSSSTSPNATLSTLSRFRSQPLALWRGYTALAGRNLPFTGLQFPLFERLKQGIKRYRDERGLTRGTVVESGLVTAGSAGSAGAVAAVLTTPVDVVKTRIMLAAAGEASSSSSSSSSPSSSSGSSSTASKQGPKSGLVNAVGNSAARRSGRKSSWEVGQEIVAEKGFKGLWRGGALRGIWTFIGAGLYLGAYETGRVYLARRRGETVNEDELL